MTVSFGNVTLVATVFRQFLHQKGLHGSLQLIAEGIQNDIDVGYPQGSASLCGGGSFGLGRVFHHGMVLGQQSSAVIMEEHFVSRGEIVYLSKHFLKISFSGAPQMDTRSNGHYSVLTVSTMNCKQILYSRKRDRVAHKLGK